MQDRLLTTAEAADYLGVSRSFLEHDRIGMQRVPFVRTTPRRIRYRLSSLHTYLASNETGGFTYAEAG